MWSTSFHADRGDRALSVSGWFWLAVAVLTQNLAHPARAWDISHLPALWQAVALPSFLLCHFFF